ncbi:hypothetical protein RIF29_35937 [Crotalaria pallida]|uniref:Uncharacterized protein n=1 Tax=Crotalaria pallida TaxID=3830 RepID=A0AAN9HS06_CROPI
MCMGFMYILKITCLLLYYFYGCVLLTGVSMRFLFLSFPSGDEQDLFAKLKHLHRQPGTGTGISTSAGTERQRHRTGTGNPSPSIHRQPVSVQSHHHLRPPHPPSPQSHHRPPTKPPPPLLLL